MDPFSETLTDQFIEIIVEGSKNVMNDIEIIMHEVKEWEDSPLRKMMLDGQRYYETSL